MTRNFEKALLERLASVDDSLMRIQGAINNPTESVHVTGVDLYTTDISDVLERFEEPLNKIALWADFDFGGGLDIGDVRDVLEDVMKEPTESLRRIAIALEKRQ